MSGIYSVLSKVYDILNSDIDYGKWADYITACFEKFGEGEISLVLDLACGTGSMSIELARRGYDMTGVDISDDMLCAARGKADSEGIGNLLLLCQDMREFELYGTVDAVVCCLDSINHLSGSGDLERCLACVHNYLAPGGLFIFDVNTPYKFENIYADNAYILESDGLFCGWQNYYNKKSRICDFYISVFERSRDGKYARFDESQKERMYTEKALKRALKSSGFELLCLSGGYNFSAPASDCERWYITAKRI